MLLKERVCYDQCVLLAKLLVFALFILYSKAKVACYSRYLLSSYFCILVPYDEKGIVFFVCVCVLVLEGLVAYHRTVQLLQH